MKPDAQRYAQRCREMAQDGKYEWWSGLADLIEGHEQALLTARQEGRKEALEEMMGDAALDVACKAFSEGQVSYPDGTAKTGIWDWFELDAQDAFDFGVLKEPKWHFHSDIRGMQHEWYIAAVVKEPMRSALQAIRKAGEA